MRCSLSRCASKSKPKEKRFVTTVVLVADRQKLPSAIRRTEGYQPPHPVRIVGFCPLGFILFGLRFRIE